MQITIEPGVWGGKPYASNNKYTRWFGSFLLLIVDGLYTPFTKS